MSESAGPVSDLVYGLTMPLRAAALVLRQPKLLLASLGPWLISLALDIWLIRGAQQLVAGWIHGYVTGTLEWVALALVWIALIVAGCLLFTFIAGIVALPFNDWLAELTESRATPPLTSVGGISWTGRARLLSIDLFKTGCALTLSGLALVFSWVPGLNLAGALLAFLLIAFQFLSFPQTRRGEGVFAGAVFIGRNFPACLGFGMAFGFLLAIPFVASFALPLAVVGGTMLYARAVSSRPRLP